MRDYIDIGSTPCEEECAQVGSEDYLKKARVECKRFMELIRKKLGPEPPGAELRIKSNPHDFGTYLEVVCYYEEGNEEALAYALKCEADAPMTWNDDKPPEEMEALRALHKAERRYEAENRRRQCLK